MTIYEKYYFYLHIFVTRSRMYLNYCDSKHEISQLEALMNKDKICIYTKNKMKEIRKDPEWDCDKYNEFLQN